MTEKMARQFTAVVEFLGRVLGPDYEVTLYDLEPEASPLVAIANGRISGQTVGSPLPEAARALLGRKSYSESGCVVNFTSQRTDGKAVRSSALFLQDGAGRSVGLLGVSFDDSRYLTLCGGLLALLHPTAYVRERYGGEAAPGQPRPSEVIYNDVASLIREIFAETLAAWPAPVERLTAEERVAVIAQLRSRGMFRLKGAVQYAAENLGCSQASVYRYLSRVRRESGEEPEEASDIRRAVSGGRT